MNITLWSGLAGMTLIALAVVVIPLWRSARSLRISRRRMNIDIYRERLVELEAEQVSGGLDAEQKQLQVDELGRRLLDEVPPEQPDSAPEHKPQKRPLVITLVLVILVPAVAFGLYWNGGSWRTPIDTPDLPYLAKRLEQRVAEYPDDAKAWELLGQARRALNEPADAAQAFHHANALYKPPRTAVLLKEAEALTVAAGGDLTGRPEKLFGQVLAQDPDNVLGLWLSGLAARQSGNMDAARTHWQHLLQLEIPPGFEQAVRQQLAKLPPPS